VVLVHDTSTSKYCYIPVNGCNINTSSNYGNCWYATMKLVMTGLPELVDGNQTMLAQLILGTMYFNDFKVDGVHISFTPEPQPPNQET
jgi:hypothetical protein